MTTRFQFGLLALTAATLAFAGCSSDDSSAAGGAAGTGGTGTAGTGGAAQTVKFYGIAKSFKPPPPGGDWTFDKPVEGMKICISGSSTNCTTSASDGSYTLDGFPINAEVALVATHPDFPRNLLQYVTKTDDHNQDLNLVTAAGLNQHMTGSGCSLPLAKGTGLIYFGAPAGSKIALHPAPASPVVYAGNNGFDPSFTEIPANTSASRAEAVVCGVQPGLYEIEVTQTSGVCHRVEGWPSDKYAAKIEVQADTLSVMNWICQ